MLPQDTAARRIRWTAVSDTAAVLVTPTSARCCGDLENWPGRRACSSSAAFQGILVAVGSEDDGSGAP